MSAMENKPKFKQSFDGCYNYNKLKKEGLLEEEKDDEIIRIHTTENDDGC